MSRPSLEVADIFLRHGKQWRLDHQGHISLSQHRVMSAIERCRRAELGGHVLSCPDCHHTLIAYNSCRNRHCPKCQASSAKRWYEARQVDLLPVPYYHVVFTLPDVIGKMAYQNKSEIYAILFRTAAQTLLKIGADPKHLGVRLGVTMVLHSWGSAMTHHPHVHCIVPGGGIALDGHRWITCKPGFFLPVRVLSKLFRRFFLAQLDKAYQANSLQFRGSLLALQNSKQFDDALVPARQQDWVVYAKRPFAGPEAVLAYLARYTHRIAIANSRLVSMDNNSVTFRWKDYRYQDRCKHNTMTLSAEEFIRRFLLHVLPKGFHRIRHYGFLSSNVKQNKIKQARQLLSQPDEKQEVETGSSKPTKSPTYCCPKCGGSMVIIETFSYRALPRAPPNKQEAA